jgi:hypothetical protein
MVAAAVVAAPAVAEVRAAVAAPVAAEVPAAVAAPVAAEARAAVEVGAAVPDAAHAGPPTLPAEAAPDAVAQARQAP